MKILSILTFYQPHWTGLTRYAVRLNEELVARGHQLTVLTTRHSPDLQRRERVHGVEVHRLLPIARVTRGLITPMFPVAAARLIAQSDVVYIHTPLPEALLVAMLCHVLRKPLVMTHHGDVVMPAGLLNQMVQRAAYWVLKCAGHLATTVTTQSRDYAERSPLLRSFGKKLRFIYPPVEIPAPDQQAAEAWRARLGLSEGPLIGFVGRWVDEKGFDYLLEAFPAIKQALPNAKLAYAGDERVVYDDFFDQCRPLLDSVRTDVTFVGLLQDRLRLANFYAMCDVIAVPSRTDNMPLVEIEALLCGTPLVVSDIPGARVVVRETGFGQLAPAGNPPALATTIIDTIRNRDRYRPDPAEVRRTFGLRNVVDQYEQVLLAAAGGWREPASPNVDTDQPLSRNGRSNTVGPVLEFLDGDPLDARVWHSLTQIDHLLIDRILQNEADMSYRRRSRILLDYLELHDGETVFDAGCGIGFYLMTMARLRRLRLIGLDGDQKRLLSARAEKIRAGLLQGDLQSLPFADGAFHKALMSEVLEHVQDDRRALAEAFRILKPGGVLALSVPHANYPFWWDPINKVWTALGRDPIRSGPIAGMWSNHERLYQPQQLLDRVAEAGFLVEQVEQSTHYSFPFIHFLVYGIGKPLIERNLLPRGLRDGADRMRGDRAPGSVMNPIRVAVAAFRAVDRLNERSAVTYKTSFVNVLLKARRP